MNFDTFLNIRGLRKGPGKFFMGVLESPGFFLSVKSGNPVNSICTDPRNSMNSKLCFPSLEGRGKGFCLAFAVVCGLYVLRMLIRKE